MSGVNKNLLLAVAGLAGVVYLYHRVGRDVGRAAEAVTPTNPDNVFYRGVNSVLRSVTGEQEQTLGTWIYDRLHDEPSLSNSNGLPPGVMNLTGE